MKGLGFAPQPRNFYVTCGGILTPPDAHPRPDARTIRRLQGAGLI